MNISLQAENQAELGKYANFFRLKKDEILKELDLIYSDFDKNDLNDDIYNKEDVQNIFKKFHTTIKKDMDNDLNRLVNMSALYVQMLLAEAEKNNAVIQGDLTLVENAKLLESMQYVGNDPKGLNQAGNTKKLNRLPTIGAGSGDQAKIEALSKEVETLKSRNQQLQTDLINMTKSKPAGGAGDDPEVRAQLDALKAENTNMQEELKKKLNESVQFNNLKKLMQTRNEQLKNFRERLAKYEKVDDVQQYSQHLIKNVGENKRYFH